MKTLTEEQLHENKEKLQKAIVNHCPDIFPDIHDVMIEVFYNEHNELLLQLDGLLYELVHYGGYIYFGKLLKRFAIRLMSENYLYDGFFDWDTSTRIVFY